MSSSENLDGLLSPFLRRRRFAAAAEHISGRVLDYGCGIGLLGRMPSITSYVGVDVDKWALLTAAKNNPAGRFYGPDQVALFSEDPFETIVALAVIEHLPNPTGFLTQMAGLLAPRGRIVLTTPNPAMDWIHGLGASISIFAKDSHEEHQSLMGRRAINIAAELAGLRVRHYKRFLLGANQLAILERQT